MLRFESLARSKLIYGKREQRFSFCNTIGEKLFLFITLSGKRKEARASTPRTKDAEDFPRTRRVENRKVRGVLVNNYSFS